MKAAQAGLAEVAAGKLAASNAANAEVKKFGEHMAQDHAKANDELMQIAQSKSLALPAEPDRSHRRFAKQLQSLPGDKFDRTYMREAGIKDHKAAYALFSNEAKKGKDPELRAFAQKTLPDIQEHLKMAQDLAQLSGRN
jgi:putative membrane protein